MRWIILLYLILNPLFYFVNFDQRDAQQVFFQLSSVIVFALGMFFHQREIKFSKLNVAIGCLLIAFVFAWLKTIGGIATEGAPRWYIAMNFIFGLMVYTTIIRTFKKEDILFVFKGLGYFTAFCIVVLALQLCNWDFRGAVAAHTNLIPPESIFFQRSAMGMYFAQMIPVIATLNIFLAPLIFLPMMLSTCTAAYLGGLIGLLFFLWFRKRLFFWISLGIIIPLIIIFSLTMNKEKLDGINVRLPIWGAAIQSIAQNPLGHGLDTFANPLEKQPRFYHYGYDNNSKHLVLQAVKDNDVVIGKTALDKDTFEKLIDDKLKGQEGKSGYIEFIDHPHNEYIWLGYEIGVQALIILGFIFYFIWERFRYSKRDILTCATMGILICLSVESLFQFPYHLSRIGNFLPVMLSFFYLTTED